MTIASDDEIRRWLSSATRYGLVRANTPRDVLKLLRNGVPLTGGSVHAEVNAWPGGDVMPVARILLNERSDLAALSALALLKLRTVIILGMNDLADYKAADRNQALARTYRYPSHASIPKSGPLAYRNDPEVSRSERKILLTRISIELNNSNVSVVELPRPSGGLATPTSEPDRSIDDYSIDSYDDQFWIASDQSLNDFVMRRRVLKATRDGVREFRQQYWYEWSGRDRPGQKITAVGGQLRIANLRPRSRDGVEGFEYDIIIEFEPLGNGDTQEILWTMEHEVNNTYLVGDDRAHYIGTQPRVQIDHAQITVHFPNAKLPAEGRKRTNVPANDADLLVESDPLLNPKDRSLVAEWINLKQGTFSGIVWKW